NTATFTVTPTSTNTPPACGTDSNYVLTTTTSATIIPGTDDTGNHCDDCVTNITLPFSVEFYGTIYNSVNLSSNGTAQFDSAAPDVQSGTCIPTTILGDTLLPLWDDLRTDTSTCATCGIFTSVSGLYPNRVFNIEWRAVYFS